MRLILIQLLTSLVSSTMVKSKKATNPQSARKRKTPNKQSSVKKSKSKHKSKSIFLENPSMENHEISNYYNNSNKNQPSKSYTLLLKLMSKRRTWAFLFILVYTILLSSSWNILKSILSWYKTSSSRSRSDYWPAIYASVLLGAVFGVISMVAALAVALPAMLITWITILVLLAFCGKSKRDLVVEGRKITGEIVRFVFKILLKEGNFVAISCAVFGYFLLVRRNSEAI